MVKIILTFTALSMALSMVMGHGVHGLEKRATATCSTVYKPVAAGAYPALDCTPFVQDPQVQTWLKLVDFTKTPVYPPSKDGVCPTDLTTIPKDQCWWTCQKCEAPGDITSCPKTGTWGLTYDEILWTLVICTHASRKNSARVHFGPPKFATNNPQVLSTTKQYALSHSSLLDACLPCLDGPSPDSPRLYDNLLAHKQKATLFIVGSRAISFPATLKRAYADGHQIAIHTWSHPSMTSLTNQQIVAELKWTEKAIFDTIGVTPLYWRPPYGDVDNRVRNIATQLGYKTSIWTQDFDTDDWNIPGGTATAQSVVATFQSWLAKIPTMSTGFIVLEHDLFPQEVDVSVNGILPIAYATKNLVMQPIAQCLSDGKPYKEGAGTFQLLPSNNGTTSNSTTGPTVISGSGDKSSNAAVSISVSSGASVLMAVAVMTALC
ncbi:hypothetical protein BC939DRAFT_479065 [Gamsiella multidivaricata]|uniref:uncharacterized protein n=1 Tax=Gamsiella multidivaricata TaxID=101098 RepID=UPI00221E5F6E|nr:uncharacterized protein BC939DRAFT_479065 [Gamsiella multidivaricata]KAI7820110.1 hypothetical protein BC939DRAFT_479065 [Gamsiella multidivaricata]